MAAEEMTYAEQDHRNGVLRGYRSLLEVPREIWVGGTRFVIALEKRSAVALGSWGYVTMESPCTIMINCDLDPQLRRETLLHEIIHAIDKIGLDYEDRLVASLKKQEYPRLEERQVCMFSRLLWATLTDPRNWQTINWMLTTPATENDSAK